MDPITQGLLGSAVTLTFFSKKLGKKALPVGIVGGMLADLDVLFGLFSSDPLFSLTYHRHFTHSLFFIPLGGLICFLLFQIFPSFRKLKKADLYLASFCAYATHAALDVLTSYGTLFLWPLTHGRYSLDLISIIDPIYTLILFVGVLYAFFSKTSKPALIALTLSFFYLSFGLIQHERALHYQKNLTHQRGSSIVKSRVLPSLGNLIVWRSVYESTSPSGPKITIDSIRVPLFSKPTLREGGSYSKFSKEDIPSGLPEPQKQALSTVLWFADDYLGVDNLDSLAYARFIDTRYSALPWGMTPLWYLTLSPDWTSKNMTPAYEWIQTPFNGEDLKLFKEEVFQK